MRRCPNCSSSSLRIVGLLRSRESRPLRCKNSDRLFYLPWWATIPAALVLEISVWVALVVGVFASWLIALVFFLCMPAIAAWACAVFGPLREARRYRNALSFYPGDL